MSGTDWEKAVVEHDEKITTLEAQVVGVAKNLEAAERLRSEIAELKARDESDRIGFKLQLAGMRNVKAARAILADHDNDINALEREEVLREERYRLPHQEKDGGLDAAALIGSAFRSA